MTGNNGEKSMKIDERRKSWTQRATTVPRLANPNLRPLDPACWKYPGTQGICKHIHRVPLTAGKMNHDRGVGVERTTTSVLNVGRRDGVGAIPTVVHGPMDAAATLNFKWQKMFWRAGSYCRRRIQQQHSYRRGRRRCFNAGACVEARATGRIPYTQ